MIRGTWSSGGAHRGGWFPLVLACVVTAALVMGLCSGVTNLRASGTHPDIALSGVTGSFTAYSPGELWGGGSSAERCVSCTATSLIGEDSAESIQSGQAVDPATGDFTTSQTLFSVPTAAGTFGVSLTYDEQRGISEGLDPSAYPYVDPGDFGWGWQSSLTVSLYNSGSSVQVNEANGAEVGFTDIGTTTGDIRADGCPAGDYQDFQKYTVPGSSTAFCAPSRVDAQLGIDTDATLGTYQFDQSGGSTVQFFNYYGRLTSEGNLENRDAVAYRYGVTPGDTGCPTDGEANCTFETDNVGGRRITAEVDGYGFVQEVFDPMGREYQMSYTDGQGHLNTVSDPLGDTTHYAYATTLSTGYNNEMTSVADPDGNTATVHYTSGMVAYTEDALGHTTGYSYTDNSCGTLTGCVGPGTSQTTTVSYPDGENDVDDYYDGLLYANCYGGNANCTSGGLNWTFNYDFPPATNQDANTIETVVMPSLSAGEQDPTVTTDAAGNVVSYTDPNGNTTNDMYNDNGSRDLNELCWSAAAGVGVYPNASCTVPPAGATTYTYDQYGDQLTSTDPLGNTTHNGYYDNGELCWTAQPTVRATGGSSCANGGSAPTGAPTGSTTYTYDAYGDTTVTNDGVAVQTTTDAYNADGQVTYTIPPDGQGDGGFGANPYETATAYYENGRTEAVTAPLGRVTSYTYDADGHVVTESDPAGVTTTTYTADGRTCWTYRGTSAVGGTCTPGEPGPTGATSTTAYLGTTTAPTTTVDPTGNTTTYTYGDTQYPTKPTVTRDPMGTQVQYASYDAYGNTCQSGPVYLGTNCGSWVSGDTWSSTNAEGQLTETVDPSDVATTYGYTDADFPTEPTSMDYAGRTTTYSYDLDGRETSSTDAEGNVTSTAYDADSRPCWTGPVSNSAGCSSPPSGTGVSTFSYNAANERTKMIDNYGVTGQATDTYTYDADGNLLSATTDNARRVRYAYNTAGQVSCIAYPVHASPNCADAPSATNSVVDQTYNGAGQLSATTDWLGNTVQYTSYTAQGEVGLVTYPSSTSESVAYHYDNAGNLTRATYSGPAVGSVSDSYTDNADEQLASTTGLGGFSSPTDTYNAYQRVSGATDPTSAITKTSDTYTYNPDGTIASVTPAGGSPTTDSYNGLGELTTQTGTTTVSNTPGTPITVGTDPYGIAVTPNGETAYVTNYGSASVTPITVSTGTAGRPITVGADPWGIAITPNGAKAYVANYGSATVTPITVSTGTAGTPIAAGTHPRAIAITPNGTTAYVTNYTAATVTPITLSTGTAGTPIAAGTDPDGIAITPNGETAYVANFTAATVTPITLSTGTAGTPIAVGTDPKGIAITPNGAKAYVANYGSTSVTPITVSTGTAGLPITVGSGPAGIAITPNGETAYVTNESASGKVTPITVSTGVVGTPVPVGKDPVATAITPNGATAYVANRTSGTVTPITITASAVPYTHAYGSTADGQRCWSGTGTSSGPCTSAPTGATSYGWNGLGQLCWSGATTDATAKCTSPPSGTTTYTYNGEGLRMKAGSALAFTWDTVTGGGTPLDIDDGTNAYIYGPTGTAPVEQVNISTGAVSFLASTPSGVQAVFSSSGALQEQAAYSTYGTQVIQSGTKVTPFGFQGSYTTASGLDYLVNRYYTPKTDQFLSADPDLAETGEPPSKDR